MLLSPYLFLVFSTSVWPSVKSHTHPGTRHGRLLGQHCQHVLRGIQSVLGVKSITVVITSSALALCDSFLVLLHPGLVVKLGNELLVLGYVGLVVWKQERFLAWSLSTLGHISLHEKSHKRW